MCRPTRDGVTGPDSASEGADLLLRQGQRASTGDVKRSTLFSKEGQRTGISPVNLCKTATAFTTRLNVPPKNISQSPCPCQACSICTGGQRALGGETVPPSSSSGPCPSAVPPGHLCTSACGMTAELLSQPLSRMSSPPAAQPSSPLKAPLRPAQPSPLPPLPPGRCTPDRAHTW